MFEKVTAAAEGERVLISTITLDMDIEKSAKLIKKHGHVALAFSPMDLNQARELNRRLLEYLPKDQIIMDTTTAALGYGLDYAYTIMERARLAGLMGDPNSNNLCHLEQLMLGQQEKHGKQWIPNGEIKLFVVHFGRLLLV